MSSKTQKVAVVTDSAAALSDGALESHNIFVARMEMTFGDEPFVDGGEGELSDFYKRLTASDITPTTSAPQPTEYVENFRRASNIGDDVFCVSLSAKLSAAYDAARVAAEIVSEEDESINVRIFDSGAAASSQALIALAAARKAADGGTIDEVEAVARSVAAKVRLVAMVDTLKYIHRSGRVPKIAVWATSALNIKPVMEYSPGKIGAIARPRSAKRAISRIHSEMERDLLGQNAHVNVIHADAPEVAENLRAWANDHLACSELFVTQFHPFMGAHTGPGLVGASWWAE